MIVGMILEISHVILFCVFNMKKKAISKPRRWVWEYTKSCDAHTQLITVWF